MTDQQLQNNRLRIGQLIVRLREDHGMTQRQLAEQSRISQANISRMEKGKYNVSIDLLSQLLYALDSKIEFADISLTEKMMERGMGRRWPTQTPE